MLGLFYCFLISLIFILEIRYYSVYKINNSIKISNNLISKKQI